MNMETNRARRLEALIRERYKTPAEFQRQTGENAGMVSTLIRGKKSFGERLARGMEERIGLDPGYFDAVFTDAKGDTYFLEVKAPTAGKWIPVVGEARLGDGGFFTETSVEPGSDGHVLSLNAGEGSYALRCKGDSMRPRIVPGDYVVISPRHRIEPGDLVACQTMDDRRMIKILSTRRDGMTELRSINNDFPPITFDEDEIRSLHFADGPIQASYYQPTRD